MHTHRFREAQGVTIIEDEVQYALPYWPLGELPLPWYVCSSRVFFGTDSRLSVAIWSTDQISIKGHSRDHVLLESVRLSELPGNALVRGGCALSGGPSARSAPVHLASPVASPAA